MVGSWFDFDELASDHGSLHPQRPSGRSPHRPLNFFGAEYSPQKDLFFGPVRAVVLRPAYRQDGSRGPLRRTSALNTLVANGLGAARGQRPRKGSCASYPTRQIPPQILHGFRPRSFCVLCYCFHPNRSVK